jgi:hypothetical protein
LNLFRTYAGESSQQANAQVLTQLCLALVDLYVQVPAWTDFLPQIFEAFSAEQNKQVLLLVLRFVPEENQSKQLHLGENRRKQVVAHCSDYIDTVIQFVVCAGDSETLYTFVADENLQRKLVGRTNVVPRAVCVRGVAARNTRAGKSTRSKSTVNTFTIRAGLCVCTRAAHVARLERRVCLFNCTRSGNGMCHRRALPSTNTARRRPTRARVLIT